MWPKARAALIAFAIALGLVDGCPLPPPEHTPDWERGFVEPLRSARAPVTWIDPIVRVSQQWSLYQSPGATRYRIWIERQSADGSWTPTYRAGDAEHAEDAAVIEHARVWGNYNPTDRPPQEYAAFCAWITGRVLVAHPDAAAVRVRLEELAIGQGEYTPTGVFRWPYMRPR